MNISESEELRAFKALKRSFHDPHISNRAALEMLRGFTESFPHSTYLSTLNRKYWWHRVILGYRYNNAKALQTGANEIANRLTSIKDNGINDHDVLLVSQEMSLTGAPRALLNMAIVLKKNGFNPFIFSYRGGPLVNEAKVAKIPVIVDTTISSIWYLDKKGNTDLIEFFSSFPNVMLNTLETITTFPMSTISKSRKFGWIHESAISYLSMKQDEFEKLTADFDNIYIVGEHARNNARKLTPHANSFKNLYYGLEEIKFPSSIIQPKFNDGKLHLIIAGNIEERKGHHILGKAIGKLSHEEKAKIKIHCAGQIVDKKISEKLRMSNNDVVIMEGNMDHESLLHLIAKCDALICPSIDDPMPIVCTEAFQIGIPVLVSDQTGTASFIHQGENGFIVKGNDSDDLATGLRNLIKLKDELPTIGQRAYSIYNDNFSMEAFKESVLKIFTVS